MARDSKPALFEADADIHQNAHLDRVRGSWWCYAGAYLQAAKLLLPQCKSFGDRNTLSYPILFLYRHYVELTLKYIIRQGNGILAKPHPMPKRHDLPHLWNICVSIADELDLRPILREEIRSITAHIEEFAAVDPFGDGFRFPDSDANTAPPHNIMSLPNLQAGMETLETNLKSVLGLVDARVDEVREFSDECGPHYISRGS